MTPRTQALLDGVLDLFPGADKQALRCLAELLEKDASEIAQQLAETRSDLAKRTTALNAYASELNVVTDKLENAKPLIFIGQIVVREAIDNGWQDDGKETAYEFIIRNR